MEVKLSEHSQTETISLLKKKKNLILVKKSILKKRKLRGSSIKHEESEDKESLRFGCRRSGSSSS